jgi:hypothetical protein
MSTNKIFNDKISGAGGRESKRMMTVKDKNESVGGGGKIGANKAKAGAGKEDATGSEDESSLRSGLHNLDRNEGGNMVQKEIEEATDSGDIPSSRLGLSNLEHTGRGRSLSRDGPGTRTRSRSSHSEGGRKKAEAGEKGSRKEGNPKRGANEEVHFAVPDLTDFEDNHQDNKEELGKVDGFTSPKKVNNLGEGTGQGKRLEAQENNGEGSSTPIIGFIRIDAGQAIEATHHSGMRASEEIKKGSLIGGTSGGLTRSSDIKIGGALSGLNTETESVDKLQPMSFENNRENDRGKETEEVLATPTQGSIPSPDLRHTHRDMVNEVQPGSNSPKQSRLAHLGKEARGLVDKVAEEVNSAMFSSELSRSPPILFFSNQAEQQKQEDSVRKVRWGVIS